VRLNLITLPSPGKVTAHAPCHVTYYRGTKMIYIFEIPDPNLSIHVVTFRARRQRLDYVIHEKWRFLIVNDTKFTAHFESTSSSNIQADALNIWYKSCKMWQLLIITKTKHVVSAVNFLKCVVTEVVLFSIVAFKTLTFHKVMYRSVVGTLVTVLLQMFSWFRQCNKFYIYIYIYIYIHISENFHINLHLTDCLGIEYTAC